MPFASIHFLFIFLPVTLVAYYLLRKWKWRNSILVIASLVFFGWTDPSHLPLLLFSVLFNYFYGLIIGLFIERGEKLSAKHHMWIAVIINILILWFYKYLGFSLDIVHQITHIQIDWQNQVLPLGISYFTFAGISYLLDIYFSVEKAERNLLRFSTYLVMFPKILQGPITRYGQVKNELVATNMDSDEIMGGVQRLITGLAKKVLIADSLAIAANKVFDANLNTIGAGVAWFGLIAYTLQIYFDFSGYTDMAVGLGKFFGFKLPENFNYPYISRSVSDFWRRWHMSLTAWFRTYLFIPLEFARKKEKHLRQQSNILIVFALTGLWHGASWNFLIWGGYFGLILAIEASGFGKRLKKTPPIVQHIYALLLIMVGWVFFRLTDITQWGTFFGALVGANGWTGTTTLRTLNILFYFPIMIIAIFLCTPVLNNLIEKASAKTTFSRILIDVLYLILFFLGIIYILSNGFQAFLYGQF